MLTPRRRRRTRLSVGGRSPTVGVAACSGLIPRRTADRQGKPFRDFSAADLRRARPGHRAQVADVRVSGSPEVVRAASPPLEAPPMSDPITYNSAPEAQPAIQ